MSSLYLMRHGPADRRAGLADSERGLTEAGAELVRAASRGMRRMGVVLDVALTSPLLRAAETARIVAEELSLPAEKLRLAGVLRPGAEPQAVLDAVLETGVEPPQAADILLVGHMPDLAYLAYHLLDGASRATVSFAQGAVARIDFSEAPRAGGGRLRWSLRPEQLIAVPEGA